MISFSREYVPQELNAKNIPGNKVQSGDYTLVKIPKIEDCIFQRKRDYAIMVEYVYDRYYDPEKKQSRNRKTVIGQAFKSFPGLMLLNENYTKYDSIKAQAKKSPTAIVTEYKVRKLNDLLSQIRSFLSNTDYYQYLELIVEPKEEEVDGVKVLHGMTYSDVEILMNYYQDAMYLCRRFNMR